MRWWCWPPAFPRPPGCLRCLPTRPFPALTCPRSFRFFFRCVTIARSTRRTSRLQPGQHGNGNSFANDSCLSSRHNSFCFMNMMAYHTAQRNSNHQLLRSKICSESSQKIALLSYSQSKNCMHLKFVPIVKFVRIAHIDYQKPFAKAKSPTRVPRFE